ncbi:major facilitator superfamily domain-containing protein [Mycena sanguinolenta]|nr:major facilitator superfamily domain-containing protein [Mycena sanguinolenta]
MSHPSSGEESLISQPEPGIASNEKEISGAQPPASGSEDDFPSGLKLMVLLVALCSAVFLVALDNTIIATAIPKITSQFQSLDDVGWYGSSYLLATASTQLLFGKFYTFLPVKAVFLTAISVFELGSLICGVAPNSKALIVGRAIAGLGSAGIFTGALIIIAHSVPLVKRPVYTGLMGAMFGIASVAGPLMGGAFTDKVSWRWCFYINLPIGAVTIFVITFFFKMPSRADHKAPESLPWRQRLDRFDPLGTLIFIPAIVCLLLALQWGGSKYPWDSGRVIALFVIFGVFGAAFVAIQRSMETRQRHGPAKDSLAAHCMGKRMVFAAIKGTSAVKSGIDNLPLILPMVIAMILSGGLITQFGYYTPFILVSTVVATVGAGLISTFKTDTGHPHWMGYQALYGLGLGIGMQTPLIAVQTVLDLKDVPVGTAINVFLQSLGGSLFISVAQSVFQNKLISELVERVPEVSPDVIFTAGATNLKNAVDPQYLSAVLEVYNDALVVAFRVATAMAGISILGALAVEWKSVKGKNIEMTVA